jgi:hypothetical protein
VGTGWGWVGYCFGAGWVMEGIEGVKFGHIVSGVCVLGWLGFLGSDSGMGANLRRYWLSTGSVIRMVSSVLFRESVPRLG